MSYKIVKNSAGDVIAFGPNCEEFSPSVNDGEFLSVVEELPVTQQPNPRIAEIKAELIALDIKRIRPLAEGDADYLATLNAQAVVLRLELKAIQETQDVNS